MNGQKICWYCSKRIAWSNMLGICSECVKKGHTSISASKEIMGICTHCGAPMKDGMCEASLSVAD